MLRSTPLFDLLCQQTTLEGVFAVVRQAFDGAPLEEEQVVVKYDEDTGKPKTHAWNPYYRNPCDRPRGPITSFRVWVNWSISPSVHGCPVEAVLETIGRPVVRNGVLLRRDPGQDRTPHSFVFERIEGK